MSLSRPPISFISARPVFGRFRTPARPSQVTFIRGIARHDVADIALPLLPVRKETRKLVVGAAQDEIGHQALLVYVTNALIQALEIDRVRAGPDEVNTSPFDFRGRSQHLPANVIELLGRARIHDALKHLLVEEGEGV